MNWKQGCVMGQQKEPETVLYHAGRQNKLEATSLTKTGFCTINTVLVINKRYVTDVQKL